MGRLTLFLCSMVCVAATAQTSPQPSSKFGPQWQYLVGAWASEASAGVGPGACAFQLALAGRVLVRTNHAEIVATGNRPGGVHDDLMVIHPGAGESKAHASYWDSEGPVIEYSAAWSADGTTLTFLSDPGPGPQFRLVYKKLDADSLNVSFDMSPPGQNGAFKTYTSGRIWRQK